MCNKNNYKIGSYGIGSVEKYLEWRWKRYNHKKYHKHYTLWRQNITKNQYLSISNQMKEDLYYKG